MSSSAAGPATGRVVHLMRHFQTPCSAAGLYCGACPTDLTAAGHAMAAALAAARAHVPYAAVYASTLPRAQASAAPLAGARGLAVEVVPGLEELEYGGWQGLTRAAARAREPAAFAAWERDPERLAPPAGETAAAVAGRAQAALAAIAAAPAGAAGPVLVVSHKATLRLLLCAWLGIPLNAYRARLAQPLGGISVVALGPDGAQLQRLGDDSYLPPALQGLS